MPRQRQAPRLWLRKRENRRSVWIIQDGKTQRSTHAAEHEYEKAEKALAEYLGEKYQPASGNRRADQALILDALIFYSEAKANAAAPERIAYAIDALASWWNDRPISAVRGETCRAYAADRDASDGTIRRELGTLRAALNLYHAEGHIQTVPRVTLPAAPMPRERWLTQSEAAILIDAAGTIEKAPHLPTFIRLGLHTGTRHSAALALQWQPNTVGGWIDLDQKILYRAPVGDRRRAKRKPPSILHESLVPHLEAVRESTRQYVIEYSGKPLKSVKRSFAKACQIAGLTDVTPHTLRHTCGTWLALDGVPLWKAGKYMGVSEAEFDRTYGHYHPDYMGEVMDSIGRR